MESIDQTDLDNALETLRAMAHPLRLKILSFIDEHEITHVNKIYNTLNLEQSITSQHLRIMREVNLVHTERDGKYVYYKVNYGKISAVNKIVEDFFAKGSVSQGQ